MRLNLRDAAGYDVVGLFYAHMPPHLRSPFHELATSWLRPGGRVILEGFEPRQLGLPSGGPKDEAMLFTPAMLAADFAGLKILKNETASVVLDEGPHHQGPAHIIQFIAQKPPDALSPCSPAAGWHRCRFIGLDRLHSC